MTRYQFCPEILSIFYIYLWKGCCAVLLYSFLCTHIRSVIQSTKICFPTRPTCHSSGHMTQLYPRVFLFDCSLNKNNWQNHAYFLDPDTLCRMSGTSSLLVGLSAMFSEVGVPGARWPVAMWTCNLAMARPSPAHCANCVLARADATQSCPNLTTPLLTLHRAGTRHRTRPTGPWPDTIPPPHWYNTAALLLWCGAVSCDMW